MNTELYDWFEQEWQATVSQVRIQRQTKMSPLSYMFDPNLKPDTQIEIEHVPIMKVEMSEPDLITMIRDLKTAKAHTEVQRRYPQLREAYMNYLSQVYLTVDKMPD